MIKFVKIKKRKKTHNYMFKYLFIISVISFYFTVGEENLKYFMEFFAPGKAFIKARLCEPQNLWYLRAVLVLMAVSVFVSDFRLVKAFNKVYATLRWLLKSVRDCWYTVPSYEKRAVLLLFVFTGIFRFYWIIELPITHDEAATYVNFTGRGLMYAMGYYTAPNNHILNSVLAFSTCNLPIPNTIALRIPSFFAGMASVVALWFFLRRNTPNVRIALLISGMFSVTYFITDYGVMARGYSFILLFFTVSFYVLLKWLEAENDNVYEPKAIFGIASVLGFYAIPTYLYAHVPLCLGFLFFSIKNKTRVFSFFKINLFIVTAVLCLYLPVVMISGLDSLIHNRYVERVSSIYVFKNLTEHFNNVFSHFFFNVSGLPLLVLVLAIFVLFKSRLENKAVLISVLVLLMAPILILIQGVLPFERTWIYFFLPVLFLVTHAINIIYESWGKNQWNLNRALPVLLPLICIPIALNTHNRMKNRHSDGKSAYELRDIVMNRIPAGQTVISMDYISHTILQYYEKQNRSFNLNLYLPESWNTKQDSFLVGCKDIQIITQKGVAKNYMVSKKNQWNMLYNGIVYDIWVKK
jgi:hypothetical protein